MATVMQMHWAEATRAYYEEARREVNWESDPPPGILFHVAWFRTDGMHVLDVWESQHDFEYFLQQRLTPAIQKIGIPGQPAVSFSEAHAVFAPDSRGK